MTLPWAEMLCPCTWLETLLPTSVSWWQEEGQTLRDDISDGHWPRFAGKLGIPTTSMILKKTYTKGMSLKHLQDLSDSGTRSWLSSFPCLLGWEQACTRCVPYCVSLREQCSSVKHNTVPVSSHPLALRTVYRCSV